MRLKSLNHHNKNPVYVIVGVQHINFYEYILFRALAIYMKDDCAKASFQELKSLLKVTQNKNV